MLTQDAILNFPKQLSWEAKIENEKYLKHYPKVVVGGMGGSHLAADFLAMIAPRLNISVHMSYGLPSSLDLENKDTLLIASSYSGNTEETISFAEEARKRDMPLAVLSTGGKLLEIAKQNNLPFVQMPDTGLQPRMALGYSLVGLSSLLSLKGLLLELKDCTLGTDPKTGEELAKKIQGKIPLIYGSEKITAILYNWKIKLNETGKTPAFYAVFPELNHNEMTGFDLSEATKKFADSFTVIFIRDKGDNPNILKRMDITKKLYQEKGIECVDFNLTGESKIERAFNAILDADWTALHLAKLNGSDPAGVPMVENFKQMLS